MNFLRKTFASLLSVFLVNLTLLGTVILALSMTYFDAKFYEKEYFEATLYPDLVDQITLLTLEKNPELTRTMEFEEFRQIILLVFPLELAQDMVGDVFDQLEQDPLPDSLTISNEGIRKNLREYTDFNSIDYLANEITIPLDNLPPDAKVFLKFITHRQSELLYGIILLLLLTLGLILLVLGRPFYKGFSWISGSLVTSAIPLITTSFILSRGFDQMVSVESREALGHFLDPMARIFLFSGLILFGLGLLNIIDYFILKNYVRKRSEA